MNESVYSSRAGEEVSNHTFRDLCELSDAENSEVDSLSPRESIRDSSNDPPKESLKEPIGNSLQEPSTASLREGSDDLRKDALKELHRRESVLDSLNVSLYSHSEESLKDILQDNVKDPNKESYKNGIQKSFGNSLHDFHRESLRNSIWQSFSDPFKESLKNIVSEPLKDSYKEHFKNVFQDSIRDSLAFPNMPIMPTFPSSSDTLDVNMNTSRPSPEVSDSNERFSNSSKHSPKLYEADSQLLNKPRSPDLTSGAERHLITSTASSELSHSADRFINTSKSSSEHLEASKQPVDTSMTSSKPIETSNQLMNTSRMASELQRTVNQSMNISRPSPEHTEEVNHFIGSSRHSLEVTESFECITNTSRSASEVTDTSDQCNSTARPISELTEAADRFITQQLSMVPLELEVRPSSTGLGIGIWSKQGIPRGMRYGPFLGKWTENVKDPSLAWEVISERSSIRGWLDAGEMGNWLRLVRVATNYSFGNLRHQLLAGQIFYETLREIGPGEELLLVRKSVIDLDAAFILDDPSQAESPQARSEHTGDDGDDEDENDELARHQCLQCDKNFGDYDELDDHLITAHGFTAGQFRCEYCHRAFAWRPNLFQHKTVHGEYKRYPCENCPRVFTDPIVLQKHIRNQHAGARSHACRECGKTFATSSGLKQHTHIHSSVKPFQCEVCFKAYTQFSNLCRHKRMHADCRLQIKCTKCGQAFSTVTSLAKHKRFCDTAPTLGLPPGHHGIGDSKLSPHSGLSMNTISSSSNPFMMHPRPPFPLLPPSLLSGYPVFPSLPSLVGGPQHPLLTSSLLLPFQNTSTPDRHPLILKEEKELNGNNSVIRRSPRPHSTESLSVPVSQSHSPDPSPQSSSPPPPTPSRHSDEASPVRREPTARVTEYLQEHEGNADSTEERSEEGAKRVRVQGEKREQPLDLTLRRLEGENEFLLARLGLAQQNSKSEKLQPEVKTEGKGIPETKPRPDHPFLRISDLLKDSPPASVTPAPTQSSKFLDTQNKLPLAYPRPMHPAALLDMYRSLDRNLDRSPLFPGCSLQGSRYPLLFPYFPPTSLSGMGLGMNRSSGIDMMKPHASNSGRSFGESGRPYGEISRPYDLMASQMPRPKDRYSCKFCGKVFPRSANLTRHLRTHTGEQPYRCNYCERSFSISSNLQRHVRNIHNKEKPFKCPLCDRCFGQQTNLDRHLKKHEIDGPNPPDSPEAPDSSTLSMDTPTNFFSDEIRSFVDKVTDSITEEVLVRNRAIKEEDEEKPVEISMGNNNSSTEYLVKRLRVE
ncbi:hypothetical protein SK128_003757 [Halocaridina rubra]|uniref:C2H2-type domain-containing protein n=1 Tax=Halocaridina rubra TaxID=373956 RepID=A0AAN8XC88_HALRR